ncbi:MAG: PKD domain-containing protein [Verrucomicrobiae bacterium]|nr:PKD domain-containing protein [Verrucomicrobiae bacterium]
MRKPVYFACAALVATILLLVWNRSSPERNLETRALHAGETVAPQVVRNATLEAPAAEVKAAEPDPWTRRLKDAYTPDRTALDSRAVDAFGAWTLRQDGGEERGVELARACRPAINEMAKAQPGETWKLLAAWGTLPGVPHKVFEEIATPLEGKADWSTQVVCMDPNLDFSIFHEVAFGDEDARFAKPVGELADVDTAEGLRLDAYQLDDITLCALAPMEEFPDDGEVLPAPVESESGLQDSLPFTSRPTDGINEGWRTLIYMRTTWDGWTNNQSESAAYNQWSSVNELLMKNSKGRYQILTTVTPVIDMVAHAASYGHSPDISTYDVNDLRAAVKDVAKRHYGYDVGSYGHQVIYWQSGPGSFGGLASLSGPAISLKTTSTSTSYHELGHNVGLLHASFLKDENAEDNFAGNIELGTQQEYGHPFDHMGHYSIPGGSANYDVSDFCLPAARRINWLHSDEIYQFRDSGTFRVHAYDSETLRHDRRYGIEIPRADGKDYYLSYYGVIAKGPNGNAHRNGARLEITGLPSSEGYVPNQPTLLDATYWSKHERQDACIPVGWTFQDQEEGLFITPLGRAGNRDWMDIHVHQGVDPDNHAPVIQSFTASNTTPATGTNVNFSIAATDPDGDELAYHWYFDDDDWHRNMNGPNQSNSWTNRGHRSVICTVTDMKGGTATGQILITVGNPSDHYITGQVIDKFGDPVSSVPVDNGKPMTDGGDNLIAGHRATLTDVNGFYFLTRLDDGDYSPLARVYGDTGDRRNGSNPVTVNGANLSGIDQVLRTIRISSAAASIAENGGSTVFTITRDASYSASHDLPVRFTGKAEYGTDFTLSPAPVNGAYNIPQNQTSISITVTALSDGKTEGPEDVTIAFELNRLFSLVGPVYGTVWIDDAQTSQPRVRLAPIGRVVAENGGTEWIRATRFGDTTGPLTVNLSTGGNANYGGDYTVVGGLSPVIPAGEDHVDIAVQGIDDGETEGREKIQFNLANGAYVKDSQNAPLLWLADDDIAEVTVDAIDDIAYEVDATNTAVFRISRTGDLQDALSGEYNVLGTALHGTDYQALSGEFTIPAGAPSVDVPVLASYDSFADDGETVTLWLASSETDYHLAAHNDTASIVTGTLPVEVDPTAGPADLFFDSFTRLDSNDADADTGGMSGRLLGLLGTDRTYAEGFEGSGAASSIQVASNKLEMAVGAGMSENGLLYNFIDPLIASAGGFAIEIDVDEINSGTSDTDRYAGFGVGMSETEASAGQDISQTGSFRGREGGPAGVADCFVELDIEGDIKVWRHGLKIAEVPAPANSGTLRAEFACNGFSTSDEVTVSVFLDGVPFDINPADPLSTTATFTWRREKTNFVGLSSRAGNFVRLDNLLVETLLSQTLFSDNFNRSGQTDLDAADGGMSGSLATSLLGAGNTYYEGYEGSGADSIQVRTVRLRMANGAGMSENGVMHNFTDPLIAAAGGFSVEMKIDAIESAASEPSDRYVGFGVGMTEAEAMAGNDIANAGSFRGNGGNPGVADLFVDLDIDGNVKVWRKGVLLATVPVGSASGTLTAGFACDGFTTADNVEVTVFFDGRLVDINPADPNSVTRSFTWSDNDANHIGMSSRASDYGEIDYFAVRTLPLYQSVFAQVAHSLGLSGANAAPGADVDGDGESNFVEWAQGTDMTAADAPGRAIELVTGGPGLLSFRQTRLRGHEQLGVDYPVFHSTDLSTWWKFAPVKTGTATIPGMPDYESATLKVDESLTDGEPSFFIRAADAR